MGGSPFAVCAATLVSLCTRGKWPVELRLRALRLWPGPTGGPSRPASIARARALRSQQLLDAAEAADEFLVRRPQSAFGIDLQVPGHVGDDEQQVAELLADLRLLRVCTDVLAIPDGLLELAQLLLQLVEDGGERGPVEPDLGGFVLAT